MRVSSGRAAASVRRLHAELLTVIRLLFLGVSLVALPATARAASFDCRHASTPVEKLVCADAQVSKLDERVAEAYARAAIADPEWKARQHKWLSNVRNRCEETVCLEKAYEQQLSILEHAAAPETIEDPTSLSFVKPPYINPQIVEELTTWTSDHGDQVVAINLADSQKSNRFFGGALTGKGSGKNPFVYYQSKFNLAHVPDHEFGYIYLGQTASGVHVLHIKSCCEAGMPQELLFVTIEPDLALSAPDPSNKTMVLKRDRKRLLIRKLGAFRLGDHWGGKVELRGGDVVVSHTDGSHTTIKVDAQP
jgi:uncharacterized protein